jgi:hypothetical protein
MGGPEGDFVAAFPATPRFANPEGLFSGAPGIWTVRLSIYRTRAGSLGMSSAPPQPVVQVGDALPGGATITHLGDRTAEASSRVSLAPLKAAGSGAHQIAFWAKSTTGEGIYTARQSDIDEDGLFDHWERKDGGIDFDGDANVDLDLPALGARVDHKDLFVEIDEMDCAFNPPGLCLGSPTTANLDFSHITQIFKEGNVSNPDGKPGIAIHFEPIGHVASSEAIDFGEEFTTRKLGRRTEPCDGGIGPDAQHRLTPTPKCAAIIGAYLISHRYALFGHLYAPTGTNNAVPGVGGKANRPGTDLEIFETAEDRDPRLVRNRKSRDFLHELGHSVGLDHGGFERSACKPNYQSVLSYSYKKELLAPSFMRYSSTALLDLNETTLNEDKGIGLPNVPVIWGLFGLTEKREAPDPGFATAAVDWDKNGRLETVHDLDIDRIDKWVVDGVSQCPEGIGKVRGFADWPNMRLDPSFAGAYYPTRETQTAASRDPEPTPEMVLEVAKRIDTDGDGVSNATDNCLTVANTRQPDKDRNGIGDACEQTVSILDATGVEGSAGAVTTIAFPVRLSAPQKKAVSFAFAARSASAGPSDFVTTSGTIKFAAGEIQRSVAIQIRGDAQSEGDETFVMQLSKPSSGIGIAADTALGTIIDDDPLPVVGVPAAAPVNEGDATRTVSIRIALSNPTGRPVMVSYATVDGSATGGHDYDPAIGSITFAPNETEKSVTVAITGDKDLETDETFAFFLENVTNAALGSPTTTVTIADDDRPAGQCDNATVIWDGGGGSPVWQNPENWSDNLLPDQTDRVCIPDTAIDGVHFIGDASLTEIRALVSYETLYLHGGNGPFERLILRLTDPDLSSAFHKDVVLNEYTTFRFDGPLAVTGGATFWWRGNGWIDGTGDLTISKDATFRVDATSSCSLPSGLDNCRFMTGGRTVRNNGKMLWNAQAFFNGPVGPASFAALENNGLILMGDDADLLGSFILTNSGTIAKPSGNGGARIVADIRNNGEVTVDGGVLDFHNIGTVPHGGTFSVRVDATLVFSGDGINTFTASEPINGAGTLVVTDSATTVNLSGVIGVRRFELLGGTTNVNLDLTAERLLIKGVVAGTGSVAIPRGGVLRLEAGSLRGPLDVDVASGGRLEWGEGSNGVMGGTGTTTIASGATIAVFGGRLADVRTVENRGTAVFVADLGGSGGRFVNEGDLVLDGDVGFQPISGAGTLTNAPGGVLRKIAGTGKSVLTLLTNQGTVEVAVGQLIIQNTSANGPLVQTGTFDLAAGAVLDLTNGSYIFAAPASVSPTGTVRVPNDLRLDVDLTLAGLEVRGAIDGKGTITIPSGGLATLDGALDGEASMVVENGGRLESRFNGVMRGTGTTTVEQGATFNLFGGSLGEKRTLRNLGTARFAGDLRGSGGSFVNDGELILDGDVSFQPTSGGGTLTNSVSGVIRKVSGAGPSVLTLLTNRGTVEVAVGQLIIQNTSANGPLVQTGTFDLAAGAVLDLTNGRYIFSSPAALTGAGTLRISSDLSIDTELAPPNVELAGGALEGTGVVTIPDGGTFLWTAGVMGGTGTTIITKGAALLVQNPLRLKWMTENRVLVNDGAAMIEAGEIAGQSGSFINNGTLILSGDTGVRPTLRNNGLIQTTNSHGSIAMGPLVNSGVLRISAGTLATRDFVNSSNGRLVITIGGTNPETDYGRLSSQTVTLDGVLGLELAAGYTPTIGNGYDIVFYGARIGTFATVEDPLGGPAFEASYGAASLRVTTIP